MDKEQPKKRTGTQLFVPGNTHGGKTLGARNKATIMLETLGIDNADSITKVVIEMAHKGDLTAAKMILDRIWPIPRPYTYVTRAFLADVYTQADINRVMTEILNDISNGIISLEEGDQLTKVIEKKAQSIQSCMQEELLQIRDQLEQVKNG